MKKFVKSFTINEKKWGRATEREEVLGVLRAEDTGKQCCLGVYLTACGYTDESLNGERNHPKSVPNSYAFWSSVWPKKKDLYVDAVRDLATINDAKMKLPARKKAIIEGFKKLGVKVTFKK